MDIGIYQNLAKHIKQVSEDNSYKNERPVAYQIEIDPLETVGNHGIFQAIKKYGLFAIKDEPQNYPPSTLILFHDKGYTEVLICFVKHVIKNDSTEKNVSMFCDANNSCNLLKLCSVLDMKSETNKNGHAVISELTFHYEIGVVFKGRKLHTTILDIMNIVKENSTCADDYHFILSFIKTLFALRFPTLLFSSVDGKIPVFMRSEAPSLELWTSAINSAFCNN